MLDDDTTLADLRARFPRSGRVVWIGLRPAPRAAIRAVDAAQLTADAGIEGDHRAARCCGAIWLSPASVSRRQGPLFSYRRGRARRHGRVPALLAHGGEPRAGRLQRDARSWRHHGPGHAGWCGARRRYGTALDAEGGMNGNKGRYSDPLRLRSCEPDDPFIQKGCCPIFAETRNDIV